MIDESFGLFQAFEDLSQLMVKVKNVFLLRVRIFLTSIHNSIVLLTFF